MKLFIQESAEDDILDQVEWYADQGVVDVARRFHGAVLDTIDDLIAMPEAGLLKPTQNALLVGMRSWLVRGFDDFRVYYLARPELLIVVRVLHGRRDLGAIFDQQEIENP